MKHRAWLWILVASLSLNLIWGLSFCLRDSSSILPGLGRFISILQLLRRNYYDAEKVHGSRLIDTAIQGMLSSLDPWCVYLRPSQKSYLDERSKGVCCGVGIVYAPVAAGYQITELIPDAPGAKAGLQLNDIITAIENCPVTSKNPPPPPLNGKTGTSVQIQILRGTQKINVSLERELVKIPTVHNIQVLDNQIGYFQLSMFSDTTGEDVQKALESLKARKVKGLVIDLRDNPGGTIHGATDVCSLFLDKNELLVTLKKRIAREDISHYAKPGDFHWPATIPVVLLVNNNTASAAEIMAGCLKDHKKATLVGTKTFGKGVAQSLYTFKDGYAIQITNGQFFTPKSNGKSIHKVGIKPNVTVEMAQENKRGNDAGSAPNAIPPAPKDPQLAKALELLVN